MVLVVDRSANTAKMYIDGVLQNAQPGIAGLGSLTTAEPLRFGRVVNSVANPNPFQAFDGLIDEPAIYNRALGAHEILAIYNSGANGKCKPINDQILLVGNAAANNISKFDAQTGEFLGELVTSGSGGLSDPEGMIFDGANTLLRRQLQYKSN